MKRIALTITVFALTAVLINSTWSQRPNRPGGQAGQRPRRFNPLLRVFDADSDGILSKAEIEGAAAKLKALDQSNDGKLTSDELRGAISFGRGGPGGSGRGPRGAQATTGQFNAPPLPNDDGEEKTLAALAKMREGPRFANVSTADGRLLRMLAETIGAKRIVEIGTSTGESGVWFALALRKTGGHLFTHEIDEQRAKIAQENFKMAGVDDLITIVLGDAHETVKEYKDQEPIDILFLDADKQGYIDYLEKLISLIRPGGLIIAHNMNPRQADANYVEAITKNPKLETSFLLMEGTGVGVTMKKR